MSDQTILLPKWCTPRGIIFAKVQLGHSYTFGTMPIMLFSPVANFGDHPLTIVQHVHVVLLLCCFLCCLFESKPVAAAAAERELSELRT